MTKQKILNKLIPHYEAAIDWIAKLELLPLNRETHNYICEYLFNNDVDECVSQCALMRFDVNIENEDWVKRHTSKHYTNTSINSWAKHPTDFLSFTEIIQALQIRVDIMKNELLIPEE